LLDGFSQRSNSANGPGKSNPAISHFPQGSSLSKDLEVLIKAASSYGVTRGKRLVSWSSKKKAIIIDSVAFFHAVMPPWR
jgi:hypothetical protein